MNNKFNNYYGDKYSSTHYKGFLGYFTSSYHRRLEKLHSFDSKFDSVLEIGGGTGEHLPYVCHQFDNYTILDSSKIAEENLTIPANVSSQKVQFMLADARKIPAKDNSFDRVIGTCVLHHIPELELAVCEIRRIAKDGAVLDFYIPCDPGMLYRWVRHWASHTKQKRLMNLSGIEVKYLWAIEHRNHYLGVIYTLKEIFKDDQITIRRFPFSFFSWNLNFFTIVSVKVSKI